MKINRKQLKIIIEQNSNISVVNEGVLDSFLNLIVNWSSRKVVKDPRFQKIVKNQQRIKEIDKELKEMQPQIKKLNDFLGKDDLTGTTNFEYIDKYLKKDYFNDEK